MGQYRKKPLYVEAFHYGFDEHIPDWLAEELLEGNIVVQPDIIASSFSSERRNTLLFQAKTCFASAKYGDYIIRGVNGEIYPCDSDVFEKTYEKL